MNRGLKKWKRAILGAGMQVGKANGVITHESGNNMNLWRGGHMKLGMDEICNILLKFVEMSVCGTSNLHTLFYSTAIRNWYELHFVLHCHSSLLLLLHTSWGLHWEQSLHQFKYVVMRGIVCYVYPSKDTGTFQKLENSWPEVWISGFISTKKIIFPLCSWA